MKQNDKLKNYMPYVILSGIVVFVLIILQFQGNVVKTISTGELLKELKNDNVAEIKLTPK